MSESEKRRITVEFDDEDAHLTPEQKIAKLQEQLETMRLLYLDLARDNEARIEELRRQRKFRYKAAEFFYMLKAGWHYRKGPFG